MDLVDPPFSGAPEHNIILFWPLDVADAITWNFDLATCQKYRSTVSTIFKKSLGTENGDHDLNHAEMK